MSDGQLYAVGSFFWVDTQVVTNREAGKKVELQRGLIYLGQDKDKIHVGYRESLDGYSQLWFSENLTYQKPLEKCFDFSFRGMTFRVFSASNEFIEVGKM